MVGYYASYINPFQEISHRHAADTIPVCFFFPPVDFPVPLGLIMT
jgi:hypothetical protein